MALEDCHLEEKALQGQLIAPINYLNSRGTRRCSCPIKRPPHVSGRYFDRQLHGTRVPKHRHQRPAPSFLPHARGARRPRP
jgi:hypothetical protein